VLSGSGLVDLYQFFRQSERNPEPEWLTREFEIGDRNAVITASALSARDPVCVKTVETFVSIYGAEAGNLALKLFAIGGVIVAGGIAPKILPMLKNGDFMNSFCSKGRYQNLLAKIPVKVAINTRAPLIGAAHYAQP
jgi:glucokinase